MPAKSKAQQAYFAMELQRKRAGKKTKTGLSEEELAKFASTKTTHLPEHVEDGKPTRTRKAKGAIPGLAARRRRRATRASR